MTPNGDGKGHVARHHAIEREERHPRRRSWIGFGRAGRALSPGLPVAEIYRRKVADLHAALADGETHSEAVAILRDLIDKVVVTATDGGFEVELVGEIIHMLALAQQKAALDGAAFGDLYESSVSLVAGVGFEPTTFRL